MVWDVIDWPDYFLLQLFGFMAVALPCHTIQVDGTPNEPLSANLHDWGHLLGRSRRSPRLRYLVHLYLGSFLAVVTQNNQTQLLCAEQVKLKAKWLCELPITHHENDVVDASSDFFRAAGGPIPFSAFRDEMLAASRTAYFSDVLSHECCENFVREIERSV